MTDPTASRIARPALLIIAGTDPLCGAGAFADVLTAAEAHTHPLVVLSAFVDQDSRGTRGWAPVASGAFERQLRVAWTDADPKAAKIGMIGDAERANQIAGFFNGASPIGVPFVVDPVLSAGVDGERLGDRELPAAICRLGAALAGSTSVLLTPNVPELAALTGTRPASNVGELIDAAHSLRAATGASVLAKGGHLDQDTGADVLVSTSGVRSLTPVQWPADDDVHGTGCALSTAIAGALAHGSSLEDAVVRGRAHLLAKVSNAIRVGTGRRQVGPLRTRS